VRTQSLLWNLFGIADLIVAAGFLTSPTALQPFEFDPPQRAHSGVSGPLDPDFPGATINLGLLGDAAASVKVANSARAVRRLQTLRIAQPILTSANASIEQTSNRLARGWP
jgi:hypothetical protein